MQVELTQQNSHAGEVSLPAGGEGDAVHHGGDEELRRLFQVGQNLAHELRHLALLPQDQGHVVEVHFDRLARADQANRVGEGATAQRDGHRTEAALAGDDGAQLLHHVADLQPLDVHVADRSDEVAQQVRRMRRQVVHHASGKIGAPVAAIAGGDGLHVIDGGALHHVDADEIAEGARGEQLSRLLHHRVEPAIVVDDQGPTGAARGGDHAVGLGSIDRHRLLDQDVHPRLHGGDGDVGVRRRRRHDVQGVELGFGQHLVQVDVTPLDLELIAEGVGSGLDRIADGDELRRGEAADIAGMRSRDATATHQSDTDR